MKLLIIIGLPGSGKTTYFNENLKDKYEFYDDFISNIIDGKLIREIKKKEKDICVADPRLCNYQTFLRTISIFNQFIDKSDISLILFENNKDKCIINAEKRGTRLVKKTIEFNSMIYNLSNYNDYNHEIIKI
jgi:adenylate kinase family enzyme